MLLIIFYTTLIILSFIIIPDIMKYLKSKLKICFFDFFFNITLSDEEHQNIQNNINKMFNDSPLHKLFVKKKKKKLLKKQKLKENIELLLQISNFYKEEINIYSKDYSDFMKKVDSIYKMFTMPIPIYIGCVSYLINDLTALEYSFLITAILFYMYFFIRIIWIQSFQNGYAKIKVEMPLLLKDISQRKFLETYILNSATYLKIQRKNLDSLKNKIRYIHLQYIASSMFLIITMVVIYLIK